MSCGRTIGHGETCQPDYLCGSCLRIAELEAENHALRRALTIGGRECAEIEFGAEHEQIEILAKGTSAGWMNNALQEQGDDVVYNISPPNVVDGNDPAWGQYLHQNRRDKKPE